jgi:hypothetical protein
MTRGSWDNQSGRALTFERRRTILMREMMIKNRSSPVIVERAINLQFDLIRKITEPHRFQGETAYINALHLAVDELAVARQKWIQQLERELKVQMEEEEHANPRKRT